MTLHKILIQAPHSANFVSKIKIFIKNKSFKEKSDDGELKIAATIIGYGAN